MATPSPFVPPLPSSFLSPDGTTAPLSGPPPSGVGYTPRDSRHPLPPHSQYGPSVYPPPMTPYGPPGAMPSMYGTPYHPGMGLPPAQLGPGSYYPPPSHHATPMAAQPMLYPGTPAMGGRGPPMASATWLGYDEFGQANIPPFGQHPQYTTPRAPAPPLHQSSTPYAAAYGHPPMSGMYGAGTPAWSSTPYQGGMPLPGQQTFGQPAYGQPLRAPPMVRPGPVTEQPPPFLEGRGLGPVLNPIELAAVEAQLSLNPLLAPPNLDDDNQPHLVWNMTRRTNDCRRTDDQVGRSWYKGRLAPATVPRVTKLNIVTTALPWTFYIHAHDPTLGVTCADVIEQLSHQLHTNQSKRAFDMLSRREQEMVSVAYHDNRSSRPGRAGGELGQSLLRLDWLCDTVWWGGLTRDPVVVKDMSGGIEDPCTVVLACKKFVPPEAEAHALLDRPSTVRPSSSSGSSSEAEGSGSRSNANSRPGTSFSRPASSRRG